MMSLRSISLFLLFVNGVTAFPGDEADDSVRELMSEDIPRFHTPYVDGIYGYREMPLGLLDACTEPLHEGVPDFRGLYAKADPAADVNTVGPAVWLHIEQCGSRLIFKSAGKIHDHFWIDGTLKSGLKLDVGKDCICDAAVKPEECVGGVDNRAEWVNGELWLYAIEPKEENLLAAKWFWNDDGILQRDGYLGAGSDKYHSNFYHPVDELPKNPDYECDLWSVDSEDSSEFESINVVTNHSWVVPILILISMFILFGISFLSYRCFIKQKLLKSSTHQQFTNEEC